MDSATRMDNVAHLTDYLAETRGMPRHEQIKGVYQRWPDITSGHIFIALKLSHKREHAAQNRKPVKRKLPQIRAA